MADKVPRKIYTGGCHCGAVRYEAEVQLDVLVECNCSLCSRKGILMAFIRPEQFKLLSGADVLADHQFNHKVIHHLFCSKCGIHSFARGKKRDGSDMVCLNARCLDDVDLTGIPVKKVDGKSF